MSPVPGSNFSESYIGSINPDLDEFNIFVSELPFNGQSYSMKGKIDHSISSYTQKDDNFYIEFTQNNYGSTICTCYFIGVDFSTMFVSPPN